MKDHQSAILALRDALSHAKHSTGYRQQEHRDALKLRAEADRHVFDTRQQFTAQQARLRSLERSLALLEGDAS